MVGQQEEENEGISDDIFHKGSILKKGGKHIPACVLLQLSLLRDRELNFCRIFLPKICLSRKLAQKAVSLHRYYLSVLSTLSAPPFK